MYSLTLPARQIPDGWTVRKPTGEVKYTLKHRITLYGSYGVETQEVATIPDVFFLVGRSISAVPGSKLLTVDCHTLDELQVHIDILRDDRGDHE